MAQKRVDSVSPSRGRYQISDPGQDLDQARLMMLAARVPLLEMPLLTFCRT